MFTRILVPLDGSELAERAVDHAEHFARIFGAEIILLQVLEPSPSQDARGADPLSWQLRKVEVDSYMQVIASRIREHLAADSDQDSDAVKDRVKYAILNGKVAENIVDFAHAQHVDLVIISTHGAGGLSRWSMSSITQKVINLVYLNVLLVRAYDLPASGDGIHYNRILLPLDSSRRAENALAAGIALSRGETRQRDPLPDNARPETLAPARPSLILATVIRPPEIPIREPYPRDVVELSEQLMRASRQAITDYLRAIQERIPVECETVVLEGASIASTIRQLTHAHDIDLVILNAHGHTGELTPYGAVALKYLQEGTKPVLIIQDVPLPQVQLTAAELAADDSGRR